MWEIWKERNRHIFVDKKESLERLKNRISNALKETVGAAAWQFFNLKVSFTLDDRLIQSMWPDIKLRPVNRLDWVQSSSSLQQEVVWENPSEACMKENFDGASQGSPGPLGVGFILRDWNEWVIFWGAKRIDLGTNNIAKVCAALMAVIFCRQAGVSKLHLEGDSLVIIQAIMKGSIEA
ncbi:uncharacterized protein LOC131858434 [Cryptomeria japonica]|uniref:uncharacterized protein LOC131858434 n=1 Tax=Cryptomeria japonica TaxID=3369 RepID=UPI0027DA17BD|nr:uncharacterized protein LOC131858434 [Cryptomeria japonica]